MKRYPKYRPSGVEWIGEIPEHWEVSKPKYETLKPVRYGLNIGSDTYKDEGVRFIRITDITDSGELSDNDSPKYLNRTDVPNEFLLDKYDILLCRSGHTVGKSYFHQVDGDYTSGGYLVRFNFGNFDLSKYFIYITKSDFYWDWIKLNTIVSTIENVNGEKYSNFDFPLSPLSEQHQIVDFLNQKTSIVDELIGKKLRKIELLKEQRTNIINHTVTKGLNPNVQMKDSGIEWIGEIPEKWSTVGFTKIIRIRHGFQFREYDFTDSGIKVIKITQLDKEGYLNLSDCSFIDENRLKQFLDILINEDDVLMCLTGGTIGKIIKVGKVGEPLVQNYRVGHFSPLNDRIINDYIFWFMNSDYLINQIFFEIRTTGQPNIGIEDFRKMTVFLPPLPEQHQIVEYLDKKTTEIDTTITLENKKIDLLKEYRQILISEVVTGKIDIRKN